MIAFSSRPYTADDQAAIMAIYHAARPLGVGPPQPESDYRLRYVAVEDGTGRLVGYGMGGDGSPSHLKGVVHPEWQRRGVGRALWERLRESLQADGVASVEAWVREENSVGVAWLLALGFVPIKLDGPVRLILPQAEPVPLGADALSAQGVTVTALADEKAHDPDCLSKLHALYTAVEADTPWGSTATERPFAEFAGEWSRPDKLLFLAKDGDRYVGLSTGAPRDADPFFEDRGDIFQQHLTGVLPAYRRRGIATALKQRIIAYAEAEGYRSLWTNSDNPAMCALNKKLGFRSGPWRIYGLPLRSS